MLFVELIEFDDIVGISAMDLVIEVFDFEYIASISIDLIFFIDFVRMSLCEVCLT